MANKVLGIPGWRIRIQSFRSIEKTWVRTYYFASLSDPRRIEVKPNGLTVENMLDIQAQIGQTLSFGHIGHEDADELINLLDMELLKRL